MTRGGFSLLEITLALVVIVVAAAISWPMATRAFANQTLRQSADLVRAAWVEARVEAMSNGQPYVFHYQPETGIFRVEPYTGTTPQDELLSQAELAEVQEDFAIAAVKERSLPDGVIFQVGRTVEDSRTMAMASNDASGDAQVWAAPVYFYPDGTTSSASVAIANENGLFVMIVLRGLTGSVSVSDTLTADELPELMGP